MSHIKLARKGKTLLYIVRIGHLFWSNILEVLMNGSKYFANGVFTLGTFTEHIFMARLSIKLHACQSCAFLSAIVLLLHHEV